MRCIICYEKADKDGIIKHKRTCPEYHGKVKNGQQTTTR